MCKAQLLLDSIDRIAAKLVYFDLEDHEVHVTKMSNVSHRTYDTLSVSYLLHDFFPQWHAVIPLPVDLEALVSYWAQIEPDFATMLFELYLY